MRTINLYLLTRIKDYDIIKRFLNSEINDFSIDDIKNHEIDTIADLVDIVLKECYENIDIFDGFFFGFKLPQIGKEFDLLKVSSDKRYVLNIELKSEEVENNKIEDQLAMNSHYLGAAYEKIELYTYVKGGTIYKFSKGGIVTSSIQELIASMNSNLYSSFIECGIEQMFSAKRYLISPVNNVEEFLAKKYYLTSEQFEKKNKIINLLYEKKTSVITLRGKAGTGKTLLAYDIAVTLSSDYKVLILFCGNLSDGHNKLDSKLDNVDIRAIKSANYLIDNYNIVIIDETQRITKNSWATILRRFNKVHIPIIFVGDAEQFLSETEYNNKYFSKTIDLLSADKNHIGFKLNTKIRTNHEIASFIGKLFDLNFNSNIKFKYENVIINYANHEGEAIVLLNYFRSHGYVFINFTGARQGDLLYDKFRSIEDLNSHQAIGQEFDKVVVVICDSFKYIEEGKHIYLREKYQHPTKDYLYRKMLFQAVTRVRENLSIIVVDAPDLFKKIYSIKLQN